MISLKGDTFVRKILLALVLTVFALIVFLSVGQQANHFLVNPVEPATGPVNEQLSLEAAAYFSVARGDSAQALTVINGSSEEIRFSLAHEHDYLKLQPQSGKLSPGRSIEIAVNVDPECPLGEINLPVYLRSEVSGVRIGMETNLFMNITP